MVKGFSLSAAVRAALLAMLFALLLEPLVQTRLTKVLAAANGQMRFTENLGTDMTVETIGYSANKLVIMSTVHFPRHFVLGSKGGARYGIWDAPSFPSSSVQSEKLCPRPYANVENRE